MSPQAQQETVPGAQIGIFGYEAFCAQLIDQSYGKLGFHAPFTTFEPKEKVRGSDVNTLVSAYNAVIGDFIEFEQSKSIFSHRPNLIPRGPLLLITVILITQVTYRVQAILRKIIIQQFGLVFRVFRKRNLPCNTPPKVTYRHFNLYIL